jgi:hypothetical protein
VAFLIGLLLCESLHLLNVFATARLPLGQIFGLAAAAAAAALPGDLLPAASFTSPRLLLRFIDDFIALLACGHDSSQMVTQACVFQTEGC